MPWWQFVLLGALGGAVVEILAFFHHIAIWRDKRRNEDGKVSPTPPQLSEYVDILPLVWLLPLGAALGAVAAVLFGTTGQVTGAYGAFAFGCAAPILLAQLGAIPQVSKAVSGGQATVKPALPQIPPSAADAAGTVAVPGGEGADVNAGHASPLEESRPA
jgi:hypothetical protein